MDHRLGACASRWAGGAGVSEGVKGGAPWEGTEGLAGREECGGNAAPHW